MNNIGFPRVLFFLKEDIIKNMPKGGPDGVGSMYYYHQLLTEQALFSFIPESEKKPVSKVKSFVRKFPQWLIDLERSIRERKMVINFVNGKQKPSNIDFNNFDIIFFHRAKDLFNEREKLIKFHGVVVLQSHCPEPESHELYATYSKLIKYSIPNLRSRLEMIDEYAFNRADYLVFPCEDAEEPYFNKWPYFKKIHDSKKIKYILTGISPITPKRSRKEVLSELQIPANDFIITYVGRHNEVKGYDLLKTIGQRLFSKSNDVWVISAGKEEPIKRLENSHWKEIGWTTDAHSYISAADVFVLPNRETYFDLVMLEVLALGKIVIASRTGGNKYFEKQGVKGVFLYDNVNEAVSLINMIKSLSVSERLELEESNRQFFVDNCQVSTMYMKCKEVLCDIWAKTNR